jgi:two-component system, NtrC family, sensor kinase
LLDTKIHAVMGDHNQIQQCVINLIFNAIDAMPNGGTLTLQSAFNAASRCVEIKVKDTGCGISKEDLPYIFDPFFTTKKEGKGIGLGLSTVYGIMERHKGSIEVETEPGMGSVFTLKLPVI